MKRMWSTLAAVVRGAVIVVGSTQVAAAERSQMAPRDILAVVIK